MRAGSSLSAPLQRSNLRRRAPLTSKPPIVDCGEIVTPARYLNAIGNGPPGARLGEVGLDVLRRLENPGSELIAHRVGHPSHRSGYVQGVLRPREISQRRGH
jgi:hypothetical protein